MNLLFLLLPIVFSCFHHEEPTLLNLTSTEQKLVGQWHETGPKVAFLDTLGNLIDSIDANATYNLMEDFTYVADEYPLTEIQGTWEFNSADSAIYITPTIIDPFQTNHIWYIIKFDSLTLKVSHVFDHNQPNDTTTISVVRKFSRF